MAFAGQGGDSRKGVDWAGLGWLYLFFWYFSGVTHLFLQLTGATSFVGFRQAVIMSLLWLIPVLLFPRKTRVISALIGAILWAFSLFSLGYFFIYRNEFSQSVIYILFESNAAESSEYVGQYLAWWMIPAFLLYSAVAVYLWHRIRPVHLSRGGAWASSSMIVVALFGYPMFNQLVVKQRPLKLTAEHMRNRMEPAVPWQMVMGYVNYREQLTNFQRLLDENSRLPPLGNLRDAHAGEPSTLVLVIGESTNRQHMSLYGYPRATTPKLDAMREQLMVFSNVVSPRPYTIETLQQVLTFADQENPDLFLTQPSLMNMMRQAGYKSYWITNQQTMTKRNTMLTAFSKQTDEQFYLNNTRAQNSRQYDGNVLEPFAKVLQDPAPRKFIVVHLLGTHMKYDYRYPPEYGRFTGRDDAPDWLTEDQLPVYNSYDNAVLYNDFVVSGLIDKLAATQPNGLLLYFSDHGEDVYDSPGHKVLGREEARPTLPMYAIPFIVWTSEKWRAAHPQDYRATLDRPYSVSHFIHTWADLVGLRFDGFDSSKSLLSHDFKERPLLVGNPYARKSLMDLRVLMHPSRPEKLVKQ